MHQDESRQHGHGLGAKLPAVSLRGHNGDLGEHPQGDVLPAPPHPRA